MHRHPLSARRSHSILARAIAGTYYRADGGEGTGGGGATPPAPPAGPNISEADVEARVQAAIEAERKKLAADRQKEKDEAERKKAEEQGEFQKLAERERADREASDRRAADAERRAQLAEVNVGLRDHLAAKHPDYLPNAADIMLHVERKLAADAKPDDVKKLVETEAKAFVERTPRGRVSPPPAAPSNRAAPVPLGQRKNNEDGVEAIRFRGPASSF